MVGFMRSAFHSKKLTGLLDILGVSDDEVWNYGQALRLLSQDMGCCHLAFARLHDLIDDNTIQEPATEEDYLRNASKYRDEIIRKYLPVDFDPVAFIAKDFDATCTFRGYIKFLETDLADNTFEGKLETKSQIKRHHEYVARSMIVRGKASVLHFTTMIYSYFSARRSQRKLPATYRTMCGYQFIPLRRPISFPCR